MPLALAIISLGVLIFVHELGHFLIAKSFGVYVERFSLGFGPKIFSFKKGETEYALSSIPLGGYVKMLGEDAEEEIPEELASRSFSAKPVWQRACIVLAGPLSNVVFALLVVFFVNLFGTPVLLPKVGKLVEGAPAEKAGIKPGDLIVAINGVKVSSWEDMAKIIHKSPGKKLVLTIKRGSRLLKLSIIPESKKVTNAFGEQRTIGLIGIYPSGDTVVIRHGPFKAFYMAFKQTYDMVAVTVKGIIKLIQRRVSVRSIGGPIMIVQIATKQAKSGLLQFLFFTAFISVNLGVINLLPIPVLDGGHMLFLGLEAVRRRPLSRRTMEFVQQIGLAIIILIMILALYNDLLRIFSTGK